MGKDNDELVHARYWDKRYNEELETYDWNRK